MTSLAQLLNLGALVAMRKNDGGSIAVAATYRGEEFACDHSDLDRALALVLGDVEASIAAAAIDEAAS